MAEDKKKYNIIDLFVLLHPNRSSALINEAEAVSIAYNLDFGNLKFNLFKLTDDSIDKSVLFLTSMNLLTTVPVYSSSAFRVNGSIETDPQIICVEQLINRTHEEWQKNRPVAVFEKLNYTRLEEPKTEDNKTFKQLLRMNMNESEIIERHPEVIPDKFCIPFMRLKVYDKGTMYFYDFKDWQLKCLEHALNFTYNNGFILRGNREIIR